MKKVLFLLLFTLFTTWLSAQTIFISDAFNIRNDQGYSLIGQVEDDFLLFRDKTTDFEIQAFDDKMRKSWKKTIELQKRRSRVMDVISPSKDFFYVLYQYRRKNETLLQMHRYNGKAILVDSTLVKNYGNQYYNLSSEIIYSENKNILLMYRLDDYKMLNAIAFDLKNMKLLWDKEIKLQDLEYGRAFRDIIIDNQANLYIALERNNQKSSKKPHFFEIIQYNYDTDNLENYSINIEQKLTYDILFSYDNLNNKLVGAGMFSNKSKAKSSGHFFLNIPSHSPQDYTLTYEDFDMELIKNLEGKKLKENKEIYIQNIRVVEIIHRRDGGILAVYEKIKELERNVVSAGRGYYAENGKEIIDYYYEDLVATSIHPDGQTHWRTVLHKRQYSQDDGADYSSYFLAKTARNLRFLFNDEIRYDSTVSEYTLKGNGQYDRNSIMSTDRKELRLQFRYSTQIAANEIVVPSERRGKLQLVKIIYH